MTQGKKSWTQNVTYYLAPFWRVSSHWWEFILHSFFSDLLGDVTKIIWYGHVVTIVCDFSVILICQQTCWFLRAHFCFLCKYLSKVQIAPPFFIWLCYNCISVFYRVTRKFSLGYCRVQSELSELRNQSSETISFIKTDVY